MVKMKEQLKKIILASGSPRRRELLAGLGMPFEVVVLPDVDESYPDTVKADDVPEYLAQKKAEAYTSLLTEDGKLVITADTVVILDGRIFGKPQNAEEAIQMLRTLSGKTHHVITGVCLMTRGQKHHFSVHTEVTFKVLAECEIDYYINTYQPFDKAGAYGIQEWIGYIGCTGLKGSYYNVMGLPVQRIYEELEKMVEWTMPTSN
ncbi:Maf-like protein [Segatella buccae]|uniref:Maf-like protein n=1 Tax=Segatella buccae TaxID=28126 RepID=UPI0028E7E844|nr:Maf-like protein [Segatella buccae]